jgi:uncharacterized membrane protein YbhN (UPF0104 family)
LIGSLAVAVSGWLLYKELRGLSLDDVWDSLTAVPTERYVLAGLSTLVFLGSQILSNGEKVGGMPQIT